MMLLDICICVIVLLVGFNLKNVFSGFTKNDKRTLTLLFVFHIVIALGFHVYLSAFGGDPINYWENPKDLSFAQVVEVIESGSATGIMYLINYIPSNKKKS